MTKISSSTDFFNSMYTPCIRIKSSRKRIDINGFKKLLVTPNFVLICLSTAFWYSFCCRIESYPNVQHVCQPTTRSNRLFLIHQMKPSMTTGLHRSLHLSNRLIQCCSHCCKNSPILIMDAVVKLVNQIPWYLKWLVCICTMNCFMRQVQKEWFGGVV